MVFRYGWMNINLSPNLDEITINSAYINTVSGQGINAGDTGAIPEPSSAIGLGLLAIGAAGIRRRRAA